MGILPRPFFGIKILSIPTIKAGPSNGVKSKETRMLKFRWLIIHILCIFIAGLFLLSDSAFSSTITLLDENFDDVTGLNYAGSYRTIKKILLKKPGQLPLGTTWIAPVGKNINIRRSDNAINTSNKALGFDSFFTPTDSSNKFLVLGDDSGKIGREPTVGEMLIFFPFSLPENAGSITVSYKYVFDGFDSRYLDDIFSVFIKDLNTTTTLPLQSISSPDKRFKKSAGNIGEGVFTQTFLKDELPGLDLLLVFRLSENPLGATNTAVGIDDVQVIDDFVVPEPSSLLLLGAGLILIGLFGFLRKKKYRKQ